MSLVELPSNNGQIIAVNPHHVTAVQPYEGTMAGKVGTHPMSVIWVARDQGTNLYVCAWSIQDTLEALNEAKRADAAAFQAGYNAARSDGVYSPSDIEAAFLEWQGRTPSKENPAA
jgi:hypothetical protein